MKGRLMQVRKERNTKVRKLKSFVCFGRDVGEVVTFFEPLVQILQKMIVRNS